MKKRVNANELQKGDIIYFYDNRNKFVKTKEVKEIKQDDKYRAVEIIDTNGDQFWLNYHQKFTIDRKSEDINEIKRMQQLAGIILENQASDLISKGVTLYFSDDSKLAPKFIKPKGVGFIVYNVAIKDPSSSVISTTGTLAKNQKVAQIFNDNYGVIDINYIADFFTNANNWKTITNEDELDSFTSKYNKIYLISHNGEINKLQESVNEEFNPFLDTEEGGYMREYIDDVVEDYMGEPESLNLEYRDDFNIAFDEALKRLKQNHPELDFEAIIKNKESFF